MGRLNNQKGVLLITAYMVALILTILSLVFYMRTVQEKNLSQRSIDGLKAIYNAEKGESFAYFESANRGGAWFTHQMDANGNLTPVSPSPAISRSAECYIIASGANAGCYAARDGSFILKAFADPNSFDTTVVRSKGISNNVERALEYRFNRASIFDFAWWTPYDLNLNNVGTYVNGGKIHSNGNIYMYNSKRLVGLDQLSTGKDKSIFYSWGNYYAPGVYDYYVDGSGDFNGEVPIPSLDSAHSWAGTSSTDPYGTQNPWKYEYAPGDWRWRCYASSYAGQWPPRDWVDEGYFFYGGTAFRGNTVNGMNDANTWIKAAQKDAIGNILFDESGNVLLEDYKEIPAELDGAMWDWTKYRDNLRRQTAVRFTVYDPEGGQKYVEDTRWQIVTDPVTLEKSIVMVDPSSGGSTYWDMLRNYDYWKALGYSDSSAALYSTHINPEILDGTYGSEITAGQTTMQVDNTNSAQQSEAWSSFVASAGLDDVLLTNEQGKDLESPSFGTTYKEKSRTSGLYFSKSGDTQTLNYANGGQATYTAPSCPAYDPDNPDAYNDCVEQSIDILVARLNTDEEGQPLPEGEQAAKKIKFINAYTYQQNIALELDLGKMQAAGTFPVNGMVYSEIPVRLTNASQLPFTGEAKQSSFSVIGEDNVYLKGNYNNGADWLTSAIISKKHIYTLSQDFIDPQVAPALVYYPSYPYIWAKKDADGNLIEAQINDSSARWYVYWDLADVDGQPPLRTQARTLRDAIQADWQNTFYQSDPSGSQLYTVSSTHPMINGQTWGASPNTVNQDQDYNFLAVSYYNGYTTGDSNWIQRDEIPRGGLPSGMNLERWYWQWPPKTKNMLGAYFQLEWGDEDDPDRFTAHKSDGPLDCYFYKPTTDFTVDAAGNPLPVYPTGETFHYRLYFVDYPSARINCAYDKRFRNPNYAMNKPIFFGGEPSWREIPVSAF